MSVNRFHFSRSGACATDAQPVHNLCTGEMGAQKIAKVNASADLTRSQSLQSFSTFALLGACGLKEQ